MLAFIGRDDGVDILEASAASLLNQLEQAEGTITPVAQHHLVDRAVERKIKGSQRASVDTLFEEQGAQPAGIDDGLAGAIRAGRIHGVCRITHQQHRAIVPGINGVAVDHRIFKGDRALSQHGWNVEPVVFHALEVVQKAVDLHFVVPAGAFPALLAVDPDLGDPVDQRQAVGVGLGNGVDDKPPVFFAQTDKRRAGADGGCTGHTPPHDGSTPVNGRLVGVHLCTDGRMKTVSPEQQLAANGRQVIAARRLD